MSDKLDAVKSNISKMFIGSSKSVELVLVALLAGGHVLIEDVPGVGKTTLVRALASSLGCSFRRIQFAPDLMPSDITGFTMPDLRTHELRFRPGAIMHQIILADEINRTSPKTQSALLEAMQEGQVTVDGETHQLPRPFMVLATQNPVEHTGTFVLPEAQLDRFLLRVSLGYPSEDEELSILSLHGHAPPSAAAPVLSGEEVLELCSRADSIVCSDPLKKYIIQLAAAPRRSESLRLGASPRATIALMQAAKALALLRGRDFALPDDVQAVAEPVLAHRLMLRPEARLRDITAGQIVKNTISSVKVPDSI